MFFYLVDNDFLMVSVMAAPFQFYRVEKVLKQVAIRGFRALHKRKITIQLSGDYYDNFTVNKHSLFKHRILEYLKRIEKVINL